ncbi:aldehyde dehydrogenase [Nitzschia inconspicua]|uniref:Aldehyde dehydrogenase n=1 Tax=Nitzschia inconspicua TaxID=303405 RepID=A0A9K3LZP9_9STRA|nr:aldehyde dehydrogenase [Nitzschia inconspicua]
MVQGVQIEVNDDDGVQYLINTNPATDQIISKVACTTLDELETKIVTSKAAQQKWRLKSPEERVAVLQEALREVATVQDQLVTLMVQEMGKPIGEAEEELEFAINKDEYFQVLLESLQPQQYENSTVVRHPYGVVAVMSPWNFPVDEILLLALPSLASGNTVIVKPSEVVPETGALLVKTLQSKLPHGVLQLAQGAGDVGAALVQHPGVSLVAMTGSTATGKKILQSASTQLKRVILEMGGKDPMIVLEDADLESAAKDAVAYSLCNSGQVCCSIERIYVANSVYEQFQQLCAKEAASYKVGDGMDPSTNVGPLVSKLQQEQVQTQVQDALEKGAKKLYQSEAVPTTGSFYPVTVLSDVQSEMKLFSAETFGPVVAMTSFDGTEEQAVILANQTEYGLGSCVYTQDMAKAQRIAAMIDAGQVGINCYPLEGMDVQCPWVGHKQSGYGFHSGYAGFLQFSIPKTIVHKK